MSKLGLVSKTNNKYISNVTVPAGITSDGISSDKGNPVVYKDFLGKDVSKTNKISSSLFVTSVNITGLFTVGTSFRITTIDGSSQSDYQTTLSDTTIGHVIQKINDLKIPDIRANEVTRENLVSFEIIAKNKYIQIVNVVNDFLSEAGIVKNSFDGTYAIATPVLTGIHEVTGYKDDNVTLNADLSMSDDTILVNNGHNLETPPFPYVTVSSAAKLTSSDMKAVEICLNINTEDEYFIPFETRSPDIPKLQTNISNDSNCKQNKISMSSKYTEERTIIYEYSGQFCITDSTFVPTTATENEIYRQSISRFLTNSKEFKADRYQSIAGNHVSSKPPSIWIENGTTIPTRVEYWHLIPYIHKFNTVSGITNYYDEIDAGIDGTNFSISIKGRTVNITLDASDNTEGVYGSMLSSGSLRGIIESINTRMKEEEITEFAAGLKKINDEFCIVFVSTVPYEVINGTADLSIFGLSPISITQNDLIWKIKRFYFGTKASKSGLTSSFDSYVMVSNANRTTYDVVSTPGAVTGTTLTSLDDISQVNRSLSSTNTNLKLSSASSSVTHISNGVDTNYNLPLEFNTRDRVLVNATYAKRVSIVSSSVSDNTPLVSGVELVLNNYKIKVNKENSTSAVTISPSDINITTNIVTLPVGNGLVNGDIISFKETSGTLPAGISAANLYVASISGANLVVQTLDGAIVDFIDQGTGDFYVFRSSSLVDVADAIRLLTTEIDGTADINVGTDEITIPNHLFNNNDPITFYGDGVLPDELTVGLTYYVIVIDANTIKVAPFENANAINLNGTPSGSIFVSLQENFAINENIGPFRAEAFMLKDAAKLLIYLPEDGTLNISAASALPSATAMSLPATVEDATGISTGIYILPAGGHPSVNNARLQKPILLPFMNHIKALSFYNYNDFYLPGRNDLDINDPEQYVVDQFGNPDPLYEGILPDYNIDITNDQIVFASASIPEDQSTITIKHYVGDGNITYNSATEFVLAGKTKTNNVRVALSGNTSDVYGTIQNSSTTYPAGILLDRWNNSGETMYPSGSDIHIIDSNIILQDYNQTIQGNDSIYDSQNAPATAARSGNRQSFF